MCAAGSTCTLTPFADLFACSREVLSVSTRMFDFPLCLVVDHFAGYQNSDTNSGWFATRMLLDGSEEHETLVLQQGGHKVNNAMYMGELAAGDHTFKVQHKTSGTYPGSYNKPTDWWSTRALQIVLFPK